MKMVAYTALFLLVCCVTKFQLTEARYYDKRAESYEVDSIENSLEEQPCGSCGCARTRRVQGGRFKRAFDLTKRHIYSGPEQGDALKAAIKAHIEAGMAACRGLFPAKTHTVFVNPIYVRDDGPHRILETGTAYNVDITAAGVVEDPEPLIGGTWQGQFDGGHLAKIWIKPQAVRRDFNNWRSP